MDKDISLQKRYNVVFCHKWSLHDAVNENDDLQDSCGSRLVHNRLPFTVQTSPQRWCLTSRAAGSDVTSVRLRSQKLHWRSETTRLVFISCLFCVTLCNDISAQQKHSFQVKNHMETSLLYVSVEANTQVWYVEVIWNPHHFKTKESH